MYTLYSFGTPNGIKPTIMLEELAEPYELKLINIAQGEQFKPDFAKISPNNKIPVLYDADHDFYLFESVAILQYLGEKHGKFLPQAPEDKYRVLQWCYFQAAHIGPMFGQYGHFHRFAPEQIPYAQKRYADECMRLLGVMEKQLHENPFISGPAYSIADMAIWPWIYGLQTFYQQNLEQNHFPHLVKWYEHLQERPAINAALREYGK